MDHTSTWNAYGLEQGEISEESLQLGGRSWINYDRTKFLAEEAVRQGVARGLDAVIMNPAHLIGRYDRRGWARLIIAAHRRWLPDVPPGAGTFCHAEEVVLAHITAALRGRTGQNYLLSGQDASFVELFRVINQVTGSSVPLRPLPAWLFPVRPHDCRARRNDGPRARGDAGRRRDRHCPGAGGLEARRAGARPSPGSAPHHGRGQLPVAAQRGTDRSLLR